MVTSAKLWPSKEDTTEKKTLSSLPQLPGLLLVPPLAKLKPEASWARWIQSRGSAAGLRAVKKVDSGSQRAGVEALAQLLDCFLRYARFIPIWPFNKGIQYFIHSTDIYFKAYTDFFCCLKRLWKFEYIFILWYVIKHLYSIISQYLSKIIFLLPCLQQGNLALEQFFSSKTMKNQQHKRKVMKHLFLPMSRSKKKRKIGGEERIRNKGRVNINRE